VAVELFGMSVAPARSSGAKLGYHDSSWSCATGTTFSAAIESLMLVAKLGEPTMFARIGVMMTLNRNIARDLDTLAQRHEMAASSIQTNC
jgi:hypothetical protein